MFARAQDTGAIRADAEPEDAAMLLAMLGVAFDTRDATAPDRWRRYLALLLDGLRATDAAPLPSSAPTFASLDDMVAVNKRRERSGTEREPPRGR